LVGTMCKRAERRQSRDAEQVEQERNWTTAHVSSNADEQAAAPSSSHDRTAPQASSLHEVLRVPVQRWRGSILEAGDIGVEVSTGNDDELLGLARPAKSLDRQIGRRKHVIFGNNQHEWRRRDQVNIGRWVVLEGQLERAHRLPVLPLRSAGLAGLD